jgi:hypothetical protein
MKVINTQKSAERSPIWSNLVLAMSRNVPQYPSCPPPRFEPGLGPGCLFSKWMIHAYMLSGLRHPTPMSTPEGR